MDTFLNVGQRIDITVTHGHQVFHTEDVFLNILEDLPILLNVIVQSYKSTLGAVYLLLGLSDTAG